MGVFLNHVAASEHRLLWLDDTDYSAHLLAGGAAPWLETSAYVAWRRKAHSLLKPGVLALPVARVCEALLASDAQLRAAIAAKRRAGFPLKTLLSSEALRRQVNDLLLGLRGSFLALPLALVCPSPRAWVSEAYRCAFGDADVLVGEEEADSATVQCADFLRAFAATGIDTVLLEESPDSEPRNAGEVEWYRPVFNVAQHYRWDIGLRLPGAARFDDATADVGYVIAPRAGNVACFGETLPVAYWSGASLDGSSKPDFRFAHIPPGLQPELVLDRLASLR